MLSLLFLDRKEDDDVWRMLKPLSCRQVENCFGYNIHYGHSVHPEPARGRPAVHKDLNKCLCEKKSVLFNRGVVEGLHDP